MMSRIFYSTLMENELHKEFDDFHKAWVCVNQENYKLAAELYSEGLIKATTKYKEDDPRLCQIYIDYAYSLIQNCENFFTNEISLLSSHQQTNILEKQHAEDDLQVAWDLLEISRIVLAKESHLMSKIYFLLGEIQLLNNNFNDAILEYSNCISLLKPENSRYCESLYKIASCYEFAKDFDLANANLSKIIEICEINRSVLGDERVNSIIEEIKERMKNNNTRKCEENDVTEILSESSVDDRPVIDISRNIKKKQ